MEMSCAECGCVVDLGFRVVKCDDEKCCCADLPVRAPEPDEDRR